MYAKSILFDNNIDPRNAAFTIYIKKDKDYLPFNDQLLALLKEQEKKHSKVIATF